MIQPMIEPQSAARQALSGPAERVTAGDALDYIAAMSAELAEMARAQSAAPLAAALELACALAAEALGRVQLAPEGKAAPDDAA